MSLDGVGGDEESEEGDAHAGEEGGQEEEEFASAVVFVGEFVFLGGGFGSFEDGGEFFGVGGEVLEVELAVSDGHFGDGGGGGGGGDGYVGAVLVAVMLSSCAICGGTQDGFQYII